jgi:hypothetical protein
MLKIPCQKDIPKNNNNNNKLFSFTQIFSLKKKFVNFKKNKTKNINSIKAARVLQYVLCKGLFPLGFVGITHSLFRVLNNRFPLHLFYLVMLIVTWQTLSVKHWPNVVPAVKEPSTTHFTRGRKVLECTPPPKYICETLYKCWAEGI